MRNIGDISDLYVTHIDQPVGRQTHALLRDMVHDKARCIKGSTFGEMERARTTALIVGNGTFYSGMMYHVQAQDPMLRRKEIDDHGISVPPWHWIFYVQRLILIRSTPDGMSLRKPEELQELRSNLVLLLDYIDPAYTSAPKSSPEEIAAKKLRAAKYSRRHKR